MPCHATPRHAARTSSRWRARARGAPARPTTCLHQRPPRRICIRRRNAARPSAPHSCSPGAGAAGILVAQLINYGLQTVSWGWRLSLGLAAVPATIMLLGGLLLPESPNSLIERGHLKKGRSVLEKLRGTSQVDAEYDDICVATEESKK
jgi:hypothetical protein